MTALRHAAAACRRQEAATRPPHFRRLGAVPEERAGLSPPSAHFGVLWRPSCYARLSCLGSGRHGQHNPMAGRAACCSTARVTRCVPAAKAMTNAVASMWSLLGSLEGDAHMGETGRPEQGTAWLCRPHARPAQAVQRVRGTFAASMWTMAGPFCRTGRASGLDKE